MSVCSLTPEIISYQSFGAGNTTSSLPGLSSSLCTGTNNTALGNNALQSLTTGSSNTGVGANSLQSLKSGGLNVAVGCNALQSLTCGSDNVAIGANAGQNDAGNQNVFIGYNAGANAPTQIAYNRIVIGSDTAVTGTNTYDNTIVLGNNNTTVFQCDVPKLFLANGTVNPEFKALPLGGLYQFEQNVYMKLPLQKQVLPAISCTSPSTCPVQFVLPLVKPEFFAFYQLQAVHNFTVNGYRMSIWSNNPSDASVASISQAGSGPNDRVDVAFALVKGTFKLYSTSNPVEGYITSRPQTSFGRVLQFSPYVRSSRYSNPATIFNVEWANFMASPGDYTLCIVYQFDLGATVYTDDFIYTRVAPFTVEASSV